jgi:phosphate transport system substrate-binding protein
MRVDGGTRRSGAAFLAAAACTAWSVGQNTAALPKFIPSPTKSGVIRSWGDDAMGGIMAAWENAFRKYHPEIAFQSTLDGSGTGMAGIITGVSDLALMGRTATANEVMGFEWVFRYKPLGIQVMSGNLKEDGKTPALVVFVSRRNPVRQIGIATLAAILECSDEVKTPTWAAAGVQGAWASKPIHAYLYDSETGTGAFLQQALLISRDRWNWEIVREFKDAARPDGTYYAAGEQIVDELKNDPDGLAISTLAHAKPWVKTLALVADGLPVQATPRSLIDGTYPLKRGVYVYVNRTPGKPIDARVKEFLRFVLSEEGQNLVRQQGDFLPLNAATNLEQLKKLE